MTFNSLAATLFAATVFVSGAHAGETDADTKKKEEFNSHLFAGPVKKDAKTYACFVRVYDPEHLARHPKQKVSRMKLLVTAEGEAQYEGADTYSFRLGLSYRNRKGAFDSSGSCNHSLGENDESPFHCSVDCDGGGVGIALSKQSDAAILRVERIRIWRNNNPDEEASYSLDAGQDDHIFRLERVDSRQCASLVTDREELAAMRKK